MQFLLSRPNACAVSLPVDTIAPDRRENIWTFAGKNGIKTWDRRTIRTPPMTYFGWPGWILHSL